MYQKDQVVLIPARILNVGDVAGTEQQFLDIKFANGAQISGFDSKHVYDEILGDDIPEGLQDEKSGDVSEEEKVEKPIQQDDPSKNPDDKKTEVPNDGQP